jgi:hypothetical protein
MKRQMLPVNVGVRWWRGGEAHSEVLTGVGSRVALCYNVLTEAKLGSIARSGGPQNLGGGIETMITALPRATLEDATVRAIRSLLHRELTGKITPRSAQMVMERLVPKLEPVVLPTVRLEDIPTPTTVQHYRQAMRRIFRAAMDGQCALEKARKAMILTKTLFRVELDTAGFAPTRT